MLPKSVPASLVVCVLALALIGTPALGASIALVSKTFFGGVAIDGYDPTAYFDAGEPAKGKRAHQLRWRDAKWRFASEDGAARFKAQPEVYAPRFGGYCTRAMAEDKVVDGDPKVWRLYQGRLYLFYAEPGADLFDQDPDAMIAAAEAVWTRRTAD